MEDEGILEGVDAEGAAAWATVAMAEATVSAATACKESEMSMAEGAEAAGLVEGADGGGRGDLGGSVEEEEAVSAVAAAAGEDDDATAAAAAAASAALVAATNAAARFDGGVRSRFKLPLGVRPRMGRSGAAKRHVAGHGTLARTANCRPESINCRQLELSSSQARTELAGRKETTLRKR